MKKLTIEKFIGEEHDETINIPTALIGLVNTILPVSALSELKQHGIDLEDIVAAYKQDKPYSKTTNVVENGVDKRIVISYR